jgi:hypothetical protein
VYITWWGVGLLFEIGPLEDQEDDGRIILKWIEGKLVVRMRTALNRLRDLSMVLM